MDKIMSEQVFLTFLPTVRLWLMRNGPMSLAQAAAYLENYSTSESAVVKPDSNISEQEAGMKRAKGPPKEPLKGLRAGKPISLPRHENKFVFKPVGLESAPDHTPSVVEPSWMEAELTCPQSPHCDIGWEVHTTVCAKTSKNTPFTIPVCISQQVVTAVGHWQFNLDGLGPPGA